jgi:hypothetical protein
MKIHQTSTFRLFCLAAASCGAALLFFAAGCGGKGSGSEGAGGGDATNTTGVGGGAAGTPAAGTTGNTATGSSSNNGTTADTGHSHCGWIGADTAEQGVASFVANPKWFDAIHPKWFTLNPDGSPRAIAFTDDSRVTEAAHGNQVKLIPLIDSDQASYLRNILSSPANISAHVQQLVALVTQHGYDGLELDYEHLWSKSDRAAYVSLVTQAAAALHAQGKVITLALPAMDHDDGNNAYDYAALNAQVDVMHLMAYDYHYLGGDHLGPIAPLGWVDAVAARAGSIGDASKYVLGVANYAIGNGWYGSVPDAIAKCGGNYTTVDTHMPNCSYGARTAGSAPHCDNAQLYFEDASSVKEKAASAKTHGLGGIGYWTVGSEPSGFFDAIKASYP